MKNILKIKRNGGQAFLLGVVMFLFLSLSAVVGISNPILRQASITNDFLTSRKSYFLSEAGVEDSIYRIKNNKQTSSPETLSLDGASVVTTITDTLGTKTIETSAESKKLVRKIGTVLKTGIGTSFSYGIQSGAGGFTLGNNVVVNGSVYASGAIVGSSGSLITGAAFSANGPALTADQKNDSPLSPTNFVKFGDSSSTQDLGQSFKVSVSETLAKISVYIKKTSTPSNLTARITTDSAGSPSENTLTSATLDSSLITSSYGWVDISLPNNIQLISGTTYWVVLDGGNSTTRYYTVGTNTAYANGQGKIGQYSGTWNDTSPVGLDSYFKIYLGGMTGLIDGVSVGTSGVGNAEAYEVKNSTIAGSLYCQVGSGNNKSCNTSKAIPTSLDFAISDGNIEEWKSDASAGGVINGDYTVSSNISLGPKKIVGDLLIDGNKTLTLTGTIWVIGKVTLGNGAKIALSSSYGINSGTLVTDGTVRVSNNSLFSGSGQSGSYLMVLTTSDCPLGDLCDGLYAIDISNNAGAVILNAQKGTVHLNNNATVKGITAYKTIFDSNAVINYEQGIANLNFTNGPTGGWNIKSWAEIE